MSRTHRSVFGNSDIADTASMEVCCPPPTSEDWLKKIDVIYEIDRLRATQEDITTEFRRRVPGSGGLGGWIGQKNWDIRD